MIDATAYEPLLRVTFGMIAVRRGPHWALQTVPAEATPFGEPLDEAKLLAEAIAGVMKHVPLPTRELGIVSDITTFAIAFYSVLGNRLALDRYIAQQRELARRGAPARPMGPASEGPFSNGKEPDAADVMNAIAGDGAPLRARVEHDPAPDRVPAEQTGDPVADGVQLGRSVTAGLQEDEDPEPVLFDAFRPGETPARVEDLATPGGPPLLDTIAPVPTVGGEPVERELG